MSYKLSSVLRGHELDVRAVCPAVFPEGGIVSASRDRTARLWIPSEGKVGFEEGHVLSGHSNFISAVCTIPPTDKHPHGLVVTGGHDSVILVWTLDSLEPLHKLEGHSGAVCSLIAGKFGTLLSGSWDNTARVWIGSKCMMKLQGHEAAVWAVQLMPDHGLMLTGSADKTIKMWKAGTCQMTFTGHSDCVRGLAVLSALEFVSCSNDCTIRRWMSTGECLQVYTGHTSFIYSISALTSEDGSFVSVGEDRSLRIWKGGECAQTITLPAQSVWSVTCLNNGDIVTGSSDGIVRIFTAADDRVASEEELQLFDAEVASHAIPAEAASGMLGDVKLEDLPGPEALLRPGDKSAQTKLIRRGNVIECHQWNGMETRWEKVGEVVGSAGTEGTARQTNKTMYNGKEYDFVFDVEIQEGSPRRKLPYNLTDDPWMAAHQFLERNDLSQMFLDQVVDFILKNTKGVTIGQQSSSASDPFTGAGRYVPSATPSQAVTDFNLGGGGVDPFTGSGSYRPSYTSPQTNTDGLDPFTGSSSYRSGQAGSQVSPANESSTGTPNPYFPKTSCVSFDSANVNAIAGKLKEFNESLEEDQKLSEDELKNLIELLNDVGAAADKCKSPKVSHMSLLVRALKWPQNQLFPALDILRLAVRFPSIANMCCSGSEGDNLTAHLLACTRDDNPPSNVLLSFRIISNLFLSFDGSALVLKHREKIVEHTISWCKCSNKNIRVSVCTILLNYSVLLRKHHDFEAKTQCLSTLADILESETDNEARFRSLVAVGTLVWGDSEALSLAQSLGIEDSLKVLSSVSDPPKVGDCASKVLAALTTK
ncbi:phospholipase A-2-activating protein [Pocillopora verrucosa]|uniref:phospholipase A-2-activating protein n=1 Tax=Pocillopora verrucosa TaxID=203993 RepID=UPI003342246F